jgi:hypothetical protein
MADGIEEETVDEPLVELTVTVWPLGDGMLSCITRMGNHELSRIEGTDIRDLLTAAGKGLPRAT